MLILIIVLGFLLIGFAGCSKADDINRHNKTVRISKKIKVDSSYAIPGENTRIYTYCLDGHEYIGRLNGTQGDFLTPKADCKFCKK